ncbi:non-ribosomal peptide synthetase [Kitasatospora sp. NPDC058170]|uniref:non-ribosomal peptide synthetase n=1 Tax=Kitasatospora sp. NPDC058170 TaxID=3346364 RepID=UPI0036DA5BE7
MLRRGPGVADAVRRSVELRRHAPAVTDPLLGKSLSYRQLWSRSGRLAAALVRRGVAPGDLVVVDSARSTDLVVAMLGILRAGAAYLPLDTRAPARRVAEILDDVRVKVAVSDGRPDSVLADVAPHLDVLAAEQPPVTGRSVLPETGGDDPAYALFTSGSTGRPKGVLVPHRAVLRLAVAARFCTVEPGDRVAQLSSPAFDATTFEVWNTLVAGGEVVVLPSVAELAMDEWVALVRRERITAMFLTTSLFHALAREVPDACSSLATVVVGGEQLELPAVRRVLAAGPPGRLVNGYGPTETTTFAAYFDCTGQSVAGLERVPVGYPLQETELYVLDEALRPVTAGEVGELCVGGAGVALGYVGRPELTAERFVADPDGGPGLYRTGDLARQLPSGALEVLGRRDRQVKLRGFRIELPEIELAATATGLVDAAFVEKEGDGPSAVLAGYVLPAPGTDAAALPGELAARLAGRLPSYMLPPRWHVLARIPFGATGKVDRSALASAVAAAPMGADPAGPLESELLELCRQVLGGRSPRSDDNFLDAGGNSLGATQLASRISRVFGVRVRPAEILLAATMGELATRVEDLRTEKNGAVPEFPAENRR